MMTLLSSAQQLTTLENLCKKYAAPIGESEEARCERAERMIKNAIQQSQVFDATKLDQIVVFAQGSYKNGTNIPTDSDVDVAVRYHGTFFTDYTYAGGMTAGNFGVVDATYKYDVFKADVTRALIKVFGQDLKVGNKSLKILGNSGRISADAVPCFEFREYRPDGGWQRGTRFVSNDGKVITNWPHHQYDHGVTKNKVTGFRFKKVVRILKSLRSDITAMGYPSVGKTPSFLVECLVFNAPDADFQNESLLEDCHSVLQDLFLMLGDNQTASNMYEVNLKKKLFDSNQPWTLESAQFFVMCAGKCLGLWQ